MNGFNIGTPALTPRIRSKIKTWADVNASKVRFNPYGVDENFKKFAASCQIRSGVEFIPFHLYDYQEELGFLIDKYKTLCCWKTRQLGFSEVVACKMLHQSLLNPAYLGVAFSLGQQESSKLSDRVGQMPMSIPGFEWITDSKTARKSSKGGELLFRPSTENSARSLSSVHCLLFDEVAFPDKIESMYGSATPAQKMLGDQARRVLGTTIPPEGMECWFGQIFWSDLPFELEEEIDRVRSGKGRQGRGFSYWVDEENSIARVLMHWQSHPIYYQVSNYLERVKNEEKLNEDQVQREHNLGFPKAGGSLFNLQAIEQYATGQYSPPKHDHYYLAGLDPNMGGEDEWYLTIWDITSHPIKLVAEYHESHRLPSYCRGQSLKLIDQYNVVCLAIEKNNGGLSQAEDFIRDRPKLRVELVNTSRTSKIMNTDRLALSLTDGDVVYPKESPIYAQMKRFGAASREGIRFKDDGVCSWMVAFAYLELALSLKPKRYGIASMEPGEGVRDRLSW